MQPILIQTQNKEVTMQTPSIQTLNIVKQKIDTIANNIAKLLNDNTLILNNEVLIELINDDNHTPYFLIEAANNLSFFKIISDEIHVLDHSTSNAVTLIFYNANKNCGIANLTINKNLKKDKR